MKTLARGAVANLSDEDLGRADAYLAAKLRIKQAEFERDLAKARLLESLGDLSVGLLPDGRTVRLTATEFPEATIVRKAYVQRVLNID
jgi:hypothetical protein